MKFKVEVTNKRSLNDMFALANIDKNKVKVDKLKNKKGFSFDLFDEDAGNFIYIIRNTDIIYTIE